MANLTSSQIKDSYQSVLTTSETTSDPTTGTLQNGKGTAITSLTLSGALAVTGDLTVDTSTLKVDSANNRVGFGTATPQALIHTQNLSAGINTHLRLSHEDAYNAGARISFFADNNGAELNRIENEVTTDATVSGDLKFSTFTFAGGLTQKMVVKGGGNVGIGTASPAVKLDVVGDIRSSTGILFGSDTASVNALDDYEEGTFTATLTSVTPPTTPVTATGTYTKIGDIVNVFIAYRNVDVTGASGNISITGLPFTSNAFGFFVGSAWNGRGGATNTIADLTFSSTTITFVNNNGNAVAWDSAGAGTFVSVQITYKV